VSDSYEGGGDRARNLRGFKELDELLVEQVHLRLAPPRRRPPRARARRSSCAALSPLPFLLSPLTQLLAIFSRNFLHPRNEACSPIQHLPLPGPFP